MVVVSGLLTVVTADSVASSVPPPLPLFARARRLLEGETEDEADEAADE